MTGPTIITDNGIMVHITVDGKPLPPTRYALIMRRAAANRSRKAAGRMQLPALRPGLCQDCDGLGVRGKQRDRCKRCNGTGDQ